MSTGQLIWLSLPSRGGCGLQIAYPLAAHSPLPKEVAGKKASPALSCHCWSERERAAPRQRIFSEFTQETRTETGSGEWEASGRAELPSARQGQAEPQNCPRTC